jgi:hypothetical protein
MLSNHFNLAIVNGKIVQKLDDKSGENKKDKSEAIIDDKSGYKQPVSHRNSF